MIIKMDRELPSNIANLGVLTRNRPGFPGYNTYVEFEAGITREGKLLEISKEALSRIRTNCGSRDSRFELGNKNKTLIIYPKPNTCREYLNDSIWRGLKQLLIEGKKDYKGDIGIVIGSFDDIKMLGNFGLYSAEVSKEDKEAFIKLCDLTIGMMSVVTESVDGVPCISEPPGSYEEKSPKAGDPYNSSLKVLYYTVPTGWWLRSSVMASAVIGLMKVNMGIANKASRTDTESILNYIGIEKVSDIIDKKDTIQAITTLNRAGKVLQVACKSTTICPSCPSLWEMLEFILIFGQKNLLGKNVIDGWSLSTAKSSLSTHGGTAFGLHNFTNGKFKKRSSKRLRNTFDLLRRLPFSTLAAFNIKDKIEEVGGGMVKGFDGMKKQKEAEKKKLGVDKAKAIKEVEIRYVDHIRSLDAAYEDAMSRMANELIEEIGIEGE